MGMGKNGAICVISSIYLVAVIGAWIGLLYIIHDLFDLKREITDGVHHFQVSTRHPGSGLASAISHLPLPGLV